MRAAATLTLLLLSPHSASAADHDMAALIRARVVLASTETPSHALGARLLATNALSAFYSRRDYRPAWSAGGDLGETVRELVAALERTEGHGLRPSDYHLVPLASAIEAAATTPTTIETLAEIDLLASDAYLMAASHLLSGKVNPRTLDAEWIANRREGDMAAHLSAALDGAGIAASLVASAPRSPRYGLLRAALAQYRELAQGAPWPTVGAGPALARGDTGARVGRLRARLAAETGDASTPAANGADTFDAGLEEQVIAFQQRYGLHADGIAGPKTLAALDVSPKARASQIAVNLERWRWLPEALGERRIEVDAAAAELNVYEGERSVLDMRVVVGRPYRRTPVFSASLGHLVLSPYWEIPTSIASKDILPKIQRDIGYLASERIRVLSGWSAEAREIDPATINWSAVNPARFPYRLRQDPGPRNALGEVKFMFPNAFDVYLHDTNKHDLFASAERTASSGCIRVQRARELALYVLRDEGGWTSERIAEIVARGRPLTVRLSKKLPVHLLYFTASNHGDGGVRFRADVYDRDPRLAAALAQESP